GHPADRRYDRCGGLTTTGDQVDVGRLKVLGEVHRRHHLRSPCGRSEVNGVDTEFAEDSRVPHVDLRARGVEDEIQSVRVVTDPFDPVVWGLQPERPGSRQAVAVRVDANEGDEFEYR